MIRDGLRTILILGFALAASAVHAQSAATSVVQPTMSSWPTHLGNTRRNAYTNLKLPVDELNKAWAWRSALPPQPAWFGPAKWDAYAGIRGLHSMRNYDPVFHTIASDDRVWFGSSADDTVRCLDAAGGRVVWRFTTDGPIRVAPSLHDGRLYFGSDDGFAYCLDAASGKLQWKHSVRPNGLHIVNNGRLISPWPVRTGVTVLDGVAYYAASLTPWNRSYLVAVDASSGKQLDDTHFTHEIANATFEGPLVLSPERIIAPQGRVPPILFDRKTGKRQGALKGGGGSFVVLTPDDQVVHGPGNKTGWLTASKAGSREVIATFKQGNALVLAGSTSCILNDASISVSDWVRRKALWTADCGPAYSLLVADKAVFVGVEDGVQIYDLANGKLIRKLSCQGRAFGLAAAEGRLLVSTDEGNVVCFSKGSEAAKPPLAENKAAEKTSSSLNRVEPISDPALLGRWVFHPPHADRKRVIDLVSGKAVPLQPPANLSVVDGFGAVELDGRTRITVAADHRRAKLPKRALTVEGWIRLDKSQTWGAFIGALQDNGSYERGWLLGFRDQRFCFAVASQSKTPKLTYLTEAKDRPLGVWRHVAGVYDGNTMKLYVDGELAATANDQKGDIAYPPTASFEIGSYHDDNEHYPTFGAIHELRLYDRAFAAAEIRASAAKKKIRQTTERRVEFGPFVQFDSPTEAIVRWRTRSACPSVLIVDGVRQKVDDTNRNDHQARIQGLRKQRVANYRIEFQHEGETALTRSYECDNFFNFTATSKAESSQRGLLPTVFANAPESAGIGILVEPTQALLNAAAQRSRMRWIVLTSDLQQRDALRNELQKSQRYGQITVRHAPTGKGLTMTSAFADVVIAPVGADTAELRRVLRPAGAHVVVDKDLRVTSTWRRPRFDGAGQWTHIYGSPDNSAFAGEKLSGVTRSDQLRVQWIGRPGARYQPDRSGRKPSPLAASGRLYLQGLERLIGLNSFNGSVLWSLEVPRLGRFNMPRDCSNWCADDESLFVAVDEKLWKIDGNDGELQATWDIHHAIAASKSESAIRDRYDWGFIARTGKLVIGTGVLRKSAYREYWGDANHGWYDARSGAATAKVLSDAVFALDLAGQRKWLRNCLAVHSTITISGNRLVFAESRNPPVGDSKVRRVGAELDQNLFLVCLDVETGKLLWERSIEDIDTEVVVYAAADDARLSVVASAKNRYDIRTYELSSGEQIWRKQTVWPSDNHGGHMSRPAIVQNALYVRPYAFDLNSGKALPVRMPMGGCGTYAATTNMLVFRSSNVTIWDRLKGDTTAWTRLRPDCWLSTIPADGLLLSPEGGGGCSCGSWMETSIGFIPRSLLPTEAPARP